MNSFNKQSKLPSNRSFSLVILLSIATTLASYNAQSTTSEAVSQASLEGEVKQDLSNELLLSEQNKRISQLKKTPWIFLSPYQAKYSVISDGEKLGTANRALQIEKNSWKLQITSKLKKWFLSLKSDEYSFFKIVDQQIYVDKFSTKTKTSFKKTKSITQTFDWNKMLEVGNKGKRTWQLPLEKPLHDRMSHILKLRADLLVQKEILNYVVSYKGKREVYSYVKAGYEKITTDMGEFIALKLDRKKGDDSNFSIWLSPELNYFPVKIAQFEQDKPDVTLILRELSYTSEQSSTVK